VRLAVESMVARRGRPGSAGHGDLRRRQHVQAALPPTSAYAHLAADRLAAVPSDVGIENGAQFLGPVTPTEADATSLPPGSPMPRAVSRTVLRAQAGTLHELVARGVITSGELLATLVPQVTAQVVADRHDDPALRRLVAATYAAFRRRRTLLLVDLQRQVGADELPWIAATATRGQSTSTGRDIARTTLLRLADEAITHWPGVILPNALVEELATLASTASMRIPLVREVASDIFMGRFSRPTPMRPLSPHPSSRGPCTRGTTRSHQRPRVGSPVAVRRPPPTRSASSAPSGRTPRATGGAWCATGWCSSRRRS
jgi:hypothetical protein